MAAFREQLNQNFSDNEDCCMACFSSTKYSCITCDQPICNRCSKYELNEENVPGWEAGKRVAYCELCWDERREEIGGKDEMPSGHHSGEDKESDAEDDTEDEGYPKEEQKKSNKKKAGRRSQWSQSQLDDLIDVIISSEYYKRKLIFENTRNTRNGQIYGEILKKLKKMCDDRGELMPFEVKQIRSKFKKCCAECKQVLMTRQTASGIKNFMEEKGYGAWFNNLLPLVKSRDSCNPDEAIEPSARDSSTPSTSVSLEDSLESVNTADSGLPTTSGTVDKDKFFVPVKSNRKRKLKPDPLSEALQVMKTVIANDPTQSLIQFLKDEQAKAREHELNMIQLLLTAGNQQPTTHSHPANASYLLQQEGGYELPHTFASRPQVPVRAQAVTQLHNTNSYPQQPCGTFPLSNYPQSAIDSSQQTGSFNLLLNGGYQASQDGANHDQNPVYHKF